jgi:hypothetical protein
MQILKQYSSDLRLLEHSIITIILSIKFKTLQTIEAEVVYLFIGKNWLAIIHSNQINLNVQIHQIFENDKTVIECDPF